MKGISSKKLFGEYYLMNEYLDRKSIFVNASSICCENCCIPIHGK